MSTRHRLSLILGILLALAAPGLAGYRAEPEREGVNAMPTTPTRTLRLSSPAFEHKGAIPLRYTCDGEETSPPLHIGGVPGNARSLALVMEDPDAPRGTFDHWVLWNIPPETQVIAENDWPEQARAGTNSFRKQTYGGPCPPSGMHRYFFTLYALDTRLDLPPGTDKHRLGEAMHGHVLDTAVLMGTYTRNK